MEIGLIQRRIGTVNVDFPIYDIYGVARHSDYTLDIVGGNPFIRIIGIDKDCDITTFRFAEGVG